MSGRTQGFPAAEMEARHVEAMLGNPMEASCSFCEWTSVGPASRVLDEARQHRLGHGKRASSRRSSKHLSSFRKPNLSDDDREEIDAEIARRRRQHGIEEAA